MKYKRILLKLSGEALMGNNSFGIDSTRLNDYANEIKKIQQAGVEVAIVRLSSCVYLDYVIKLYQLLHRS